MSKYIAFSFFMVCSFAGATEINVSDCDEMMEQNLTYWCLVDKYQQSVLGLKIEEARAEKKLKDNDDKFSGGYNKDGTVYYDRYTHLARMTFPELHRKFILYREQQCKYPPLSLGAMPGYHAAISSLYCKIQMNIVQTQWIRDFI